MQTPPNFLDSNALPGALPGLTRRSVDLVVIHCSATPNGKVVRQGLPGELGALNCAQVINAWHAARGFSRRYSARSFNPQLPSIGYHFVVDLDGTVLTGRHVDEVPAQAAGFNATAIGVCLIGGAEREGRYTDAQWTSLRELVQWLLDEYGLPAAAPQRISDSTADLGYRMVGGVCGHRDLSPDKDGDGLIEPGEWIKTCPGFEVQLWLDAGMTPMPEHFIEGGL
ncbi:MAG: N-acetylmuramoyl-L-alanine amidase [Ramlibacter sp.]|nr:N-acetylmuramoyl-L-alanine amidase [Ramlibacter sp.]